MSGKLKLSFPRALPEIPQRDRMRLMRLYFEASNGKSSRECVAWSGYKDDKGYGQVWACKTMHWAHRVYYALFNGPIPKGKTVDHECRNPSCVNPKHLKLASVSYNTARGNRLRKLPKTSVDDIPF